MSRLDRLRAKWPVSPRVHAYAAWGALVLFTLIVISGAAVRLTGSGLGCPEWPRCNGTSVTPSDGHAYIEFSNRLITTPVSIAAVLCLVFALLRRPYRRDFTILGALLAVGVLVQAVLGGITVLTGLNPWTVAGHFLVSVGLTYLAYALWVRVRETGDGPREWTAPPAARALVRAVVGAALLTLTLGTIVTGSGPHAGDPKTPRMGFAPETVSQLHADAVFLLIGLTVAAILTVRALGAPERVRHALVVLLVVELAQGAIGYVQYFTGLPIVLVAAHVAGAMVLWVAALRPLFALRTRSAEPVTAPVDVPAESTPARA
jgi:cytochrome c oxidase assembly protein subunit 15